MSILYKEKNNLQSTKQYPISFMIKGLKKVKKKLRGFIPSTYKYKGKVVKLNRNIVFPEFEKANRTFCFGPQAYLLAYGGDLSVERIVAGFKKGIMPFFNESEPYLWWISDQRCVLPLNNIHFERTMKKALRMNAFDLTVNQAFSKVVFNCQEAHNGYKWLNQKRIDAIIKLHNEGYVHSVEVWKDGILVGGLFGINIGKYFYAESMFTKVSNASKYAFLALALRLHELEFSFIDEGIWPTAHIVSTGAITIPYDEYKGMLENAIHHDKAISEWSMLFDGWDAKASIERYLASTEK